MVSNGFPAPFWWLPSAAALKEDEENFSSNTSRKFEGSCDISAPCRMFFSCKSRITEMDRPITVHHAPLSLFVMIGVGLRVGVGALANCNVGGKPQAADTPIIPSAGTKIKRVCRRTKSHHLGEFVNILGVKRYPGYRHFNPNAVTRCNKGQNPYKSERFRLRRCNWFAVKAWRVGWITAQCFR